MTLPLGFNVRLSDNVTLAGAGEVLIGGSPLTALRLKPAAQKLLSNRVVTVTDGASRHLARRLLTTNLGHPDLSRMHSGPPRGLTVVIPVRDRPEQLDRALGALRGLRCIVVDDASTDRDAVEAVCKLHGASWLPLDHNVGPAAARNFGLGHVFTPYVAFVDSDVQVAAHDLLALIRHFADPDLALVGPRVVGRPVSARPRWFETYDAAASSLTLGHTPSNVQPGAAVAWLPGACLVARTEALGDGFDPTLRVGEDVDLVWRLVDAGNGVRYDPTVIAFHDARLSFSGWLGRKYVYGTGGAPLARRHGNKIAPAILSPTNAAAAAAILVRTRWSPLAAAVAVALGTRRVGGALPLTSGRMAIAIRISVRGLGWSVRQESALAVRHWWPAAILGACLSRHARQAVVTALIVDSVVARYEQHTATTRVNVAVGLVGRRLDDLAYGAGLWWGAVRNHSARALVPRRR